MSFDSTNEKTSNKTEWLILIGLFLLFGGLFLGGQHIASDVSQTEQSVILTGEQVNSIPSDASVLSYSELSEEEQNKFRSGQSEIYQYGYADRISLSEDEEVYEGYSYIQLDGLYYELEIIEEITEVGLLIEGLVVVSFSMTVISGVFLTVASVRKFYLSIPTIEEKIVTHVSLNMLEILVLVFVVTATLAGGISGYATDLQVDSVEGVEVDPASVQDENITQFEELSRDGQEIVVGLISDNPSMTASPLTTDTYIQTDGELYHIVKTAESLQDIVAFLGGFIGLLSSVIISVRLVSRKKDLQD